MLSICDKAPFKYLYRLLLTARYKKITKICAKLMEQGHIVFSPITHSHPVATIGNLPHLAHAFWLKQDKFWVDACDELWVYEGYPYLDSYGVLQELSWAIKDKKPIFFCNDKGEATYQVVGYENRKLQLIQMNNQ